MAYAAGDTIDAEYNTFANSSSSPHGYNHFAGTGSGVYGLGQTHLPVVSESSESTILASTWNNLLTAMDNIANHTNDTMTARTAVAAGDTIKIKAAVETDLATLAASVAGGCVNATALTESSELQSQTSSTRWTGSHTVELSVTFSSGDNLRHFFNAGGKIRIQLTRNGNGGGSATSKDSSVDELITAMGNFDIGSAVSTRSGSGETLSTDGFANGVSDFGTGYTTIFLLTQANGTYTSMTLKGEGKVDNGTYGTDKIVTIKMTLTDADSGDSEFTSGNTSSVDQYANFIGQTDFAMHTMNPTTAQGLASVAAIASSAAVSNTTA
jgi:hypothetical protein